MRDTMPDSLQRFLIAQTDVYPRALAEVRSGRKRSHWMWYVFPQLRGLGRSEMAHRYGLAGFAEAQAYLTHEVLGTRLVEITTALLALDTRDAHAVFGNPDDLKLHSCMTLFEACAKTYDAGDAPEVFTKVLQAFYGGKRDPRTLELLDAEGAA